MCHDYPEDLNFDKKLSKYPSVVSSCVIQFFSQTTFQMSYGYENISNLITYYYVSQSEGDDLVDDTLEIFFLIIILLWPKTSESSSYEII